MRGMLTGIIISLCALTLAQKSDDKQKLVSFLKAAVMIREWFLIDRSVYDEITSPTHTGIVTDSQSTNNS